MESILMLESHPAQIFHVMKENWHPKQNKFYSLGQASLDGFNASFILSGQPLSSNHKSILHGYGALQLKVLFHASSLFDP